MKKYYSKEEQQKIIKLYDNGKDKKEILDDYNISLATFYRWKSKFSQTTKENTKKEESMKENTKKEESMKENTKKEESMKENKPKKETPKKQPRTKIKKLAITDDTKLLKQKLKINRIKSPMLHQQINNLDPKAKLIATLYTGDINNTYYSPAYIAEFLNVDDTAVRKTIEEVITNYKEESIKQCNNIKINLKQRK